MKTWLMRLRFAAVCCSLSGMLICESSNVAADETEIKAFMRSYAEAFNEQNLETVAAMWSDDAVHSDRQTGVMTEGRSAIKADLATVFADTEKTRITGELRSVRFVTPDVASVHGTMMTIVGNQEPIASEYSAVVVKQSGTWQIDSVEETPVLSPANSRVALAPLAGMVGDWLDESADTRVISSVRWSENESFLIRTIAQQNPGQEPTRLGTQIIGFDPRSQTIRSWSFNADGSFGEGIWSKNGQDWLVKSSQTLAGGELSSGTYVLTVIDEGTLNLRLIGHEIEGDPIPSADPVTMTRLAAEDVAVENPTSTN